MAITLERESGAPVYEALARRIRQAIRQGEYQPGDLIGTEHGMAREQSISRMTVRRASQMLISEGLLERRPGKGLYVRSTVGNAGATAAPARSGQVQVITGNLEWEPSVQISRGVQTVARGRGLAVQIADARGDEQLDLEAIRQLPRSGARGAIIIALHSSAFNEAVFGLKVAHFPFVLVDQRLHDIEVPSVIADGYSGGYQVGQMLLGRGHRRIAFVGDLIAMTVRQRLAGLRDAVNDAGLPFNRKLVVDLECGSDRLGDWSAAIERAGRQLLEQPERPTAVFCSCDGVAKLLYRTFQSMGVDVPGQVSVVGFDDDPVSEWLSPPLTTVRQPFSEMGQAAIELLIRRIENPTSPVEHRVLPVQLVERQSVATVQP